MKTKAVVKNQLVIYLKSFRVVYFIIYLIFLAFWSESLLHPESKAHTSMSGLEIATLVTSFIIGLTSFKESFLFYTGCGVSRKGMFRGILISFGVMALVTALIDCINGVIFTHLINYSSLYYQIAQIESTNSGSLFNSDGIFVAPVLTVPLLLKNYLWCVLCYVAAAMFGFLITSLYYRMNKRQKIVVSAGVVVLLFYGLPLADTTFWNGVLTSAIAAAFQWWMSCAVNPAADLVTRLCMIAVFAGLSFLLIRRVDAKKG